MTGSALNMRDSALNMRDSALNGRDSALNMRDSALNTQGTLQYAHLSACAESMQTRAAKEAQRLWRTKLSTQFTDFAGTEVQILTQLLLHLPAHP